jgi:glyoxylase-like metal-dependent hydrolase (beta-lactamase superfamily II)
MDEIDQIYTGCGKFPVEQILLTHNHFDHAASADLLKQKYGAKVYAWVPGPGVDCLLKDGQVLKAADDYLDVLHTPGHSSDSVSFYCQSQRLLFSGDTQLRIRTSGGKYTREYVDTLLKLAQREIAMVYPGHDEPFDHDVRSIILNTLQHVRNSEIV